MVLSFVDVFCGTGGWKQGLVTAGMMHVLGIDEDPVALATYRANHGDGSALAADVRKLSREDLLIALCGRRVDVVVASPPCQSYSVIGPRRIGDARDSLYENVIEIGAWAQARMIVIENVCGFRTKEGGLHFHKLLESLEGAGYANTSAILDANDFGAPQTRRRLIIVARKPCIAGFEFPRAVLPRHTMNEVLQPRETVTDPFYWMTPEKTRYYIERRASRPNHVRFVDIHRPAQTMRAGYMKSRGAEALVFYAEDGACRMLTERECATIQTFPSAYAWRGSRTAMYRQIGNAVPPKLAEHLGLAIVAAFAFQEIGS